MTIDQLPQLQKSFYLKSYENGRFIKDAFFHMTKAELGEVDRVLVEVGHPLAFEPGTQESRVIALIKEFGY